LEIFVPDFGHQALLFVNEATHVKCKTRLLSAHDEPMHSPHLIVDTITWWSLFLLYWE